MQIREAQCYQGNWNECVIIAPKMHPSMQRTALHHIHAAMPHLVGHAEFILQHNIFPLLVKIAGISLAFKVTNWPQTQWFLCELYLTCWFARCLLMYMRRGAKVKRMIIHWQHAAAGVIRWWARALQANNLLCVRACCSPFTLLWRRLKPLSSLLVKMVMRKRRWRAARPNHHNAKLALSPN